MIRRNAGVPDHRDFEVVTQFVRDFLSRREAGCLHSELKKIARRRFKKAFPPDPRTFEAIIFHLIRAKEIEEVNGKLRLRVK